MVALRERCPTRPDRKPIAEQLKRLGNEQRHTVAGLVLLLTDPEISRDVKQKVTNFVRIGVEKIKEDASKAIRV